MRLRNAIVLAVAGVAAALTPGGAAAGNLTGLLAGPVAKIKHASRVPVLLPSSMPLGHLRLYASGGPVRGGYYLELDAAPNCRGADACFVAQFSALRGAGRFGQRVALRGGTIAGFLPLSCGASCSPPQIDWVTKGVLYTIQARVETRRGDRRALVAAAEQAIAAGPR